jgi:hypothetical protein
MGIRYVELASHVPGNQATAAEREAFRARLEPFISDLGRFKVGSLSEGHNADEWIKQMRAVAGE